MGERMSVARRLRARGERGRGVWAAAAALTAVTLLGGAVGGGCSAQDDADEPRHHAALRTQAQALRPAHADQMYDSPGGHARVWWAASGEHAPPLADVDADGVPDFVVSVARTADAVIGWLEARGWRLALSDQALNDGTGFGGDARFDIYLENFRAGDGHRVVEACEDLADGVRHCAGYFVMENDFAGSGYASLDEAVSVLVSHEYFHTVQDAYQADIPAWWSEGSATWFEEAFDPAQSDFEALAGLYFSDTGRSLLGFIRGPSDSFSYATSLFVYFLALHVGDDGIKRVFEGLGAGQPLLAAIEAQLGGHFDSLGAAFRTFAAWNALTATRAVEGFGYPQASRWRGLTLTPLSAAQPFNWDRQVEAFAADYAALSVDRPATLALEAVAGWSQPLDLMLVRVDGGAVNVTHLKAGDPPLTLAPGPTTYVVLVNAHTEGLAAGRVALRHPAPDGDTSGSDTSGSNPNSTDTSGGSDGGCQAAPARLPQRSQWTGALLWLIFGAAAASLRRRARAR